MHQSRGEQCFIEVKFKRIPRHCNETCNGLRDVENLSAGVVIGAGLMA
jgi:hypothetical protein